MKLRTSRTAPFALAAALVGCATAAGTVRFGPDDPGRAAAGLAPCGVILGRTTRPALIDPTKPVTVIVHGCNSSGGRFKTLAGVFEAHGQQTVCFNYDDRDRIDATAAELATSLGILETYLDAPSFTVVGHSQGGLVSRRALTKLHRDKRSTRTDVAYELVTVSSPFGGISASKDCARTWLHVVSLGFTAAVCQSIAGDIWREIFPGSTFISEPGELSSAVRRHHVVRTDERGTCRQTNRRGKCSEDDFVFSLGEQSNPRVDAVDQAVVDTVEAGHVEVVGERGTPPRKLIEVLREQAILTPLAEPETARADLAIARVYRNLGA